MRKHTIEIRVRYAETDQMGVVYYANYLVWFEIARTEFFRARGIEYREIEENDKIFLPVVDVYCRYKAPLRYDDVVTIDTKLADIGAMRVVFEYEVKKNSVITTTGTTKHVFVDKKGSPVPVPDTIRKCFESPNNFR